MFCQLRLFVAVLFVCLLSTLAHAFVPISVYPNPLTFGTVAQNTTGYLLVYITNTAANSVVITAASMSGTNASDFAFYGGSCVGTLLANQTCQTTLSFTPPVVGSRTANLVISVQGLSQQISTVVQGTGGNPPPTITSLSPPSAYVNSPQLTLTVNGTGFQSGAFVYWASTSTSLTTTFVSSTQLTAVIPASDLTNTYTDWLWVTNPDGQSSGTAYFYIVALDPSIQSISPTTVVAGTTPTPIVVSGSNFMNGASIQWNGKPLATTYLNTGQLQATPSTAQLKSASIVQLSVSNPPPGGISPYLDFDVTYPNKTTILDLPANDLIWDPYAQRIYASLPSSYGTHGNTIAVINPSTGKVIGYHFAGSEPNQLALSSDSKYLYVGLNGNGSVQRFILPAFNPDIDVNLGSSTYGGLNTALSLQVSPSDSHTFAVAEGTSGCCGFTGLYFFKDSTQLADSITYPTITDIVFVNSSTLYGYSNSTVSDVSVTSSGGTLGQQWNGLVQGTYILYDNGLIYGNDGQAFDPATGLLVGTYDITGSSCCYYSNQIVSNSAINRIFALGVTPFLSSFGVTSYNLSTFTPVAVTNLSQLSGNTSASPTFIPWGNNGVAFVLAPGCCSGSSQTVLVQSPAMLLTSTTTKNPVPTAQSLTPSSVTHGSGNLLVTVKGTGFVPGSQVTWNGTALYAAYVSSTQLNLYVPANSIASAGSATIVVTNPAPGGGSSTAPPFTIN